MDPVRLSVPQRGSVFRGEFTEESLGQADCAADISSINLVILFSIEVARDGNSSRGR